MSDDMSILDDIEGRLGEAERIGAQAMAVKPSEVRLVRVAAYERAALIADAWCKSDYSEECNVMAQSIADEIRALKP